MGINRLDKNGSHRAVFDRNKKKIFARQSCCALCGKPVDFKLKFPHPMSPTIDHIIPIAKGGHPSDIDNLQLAHFICNRQKSDKLFSNHAKEQKIITNRDLPLTIDWKAYRAKESK